jgi:uncharacterized protein YjdB
MKMKNMMFLMLSLLLLGTASMDSQVTIGNTSAPREGSILDLQSDSKGLLLPQVRLTDIGVYLPGVTPIDGMLVFNTNDGVLNGEGKGVYVWDNTKLQWVFNGYRAGAVVVPVTAVNVTSPVDFIISGHDLQFTAEVIPAGATNRTVNWDVVPGTGSGIITQTGLFTAQAAGSVQIRATSNDNPAIQGAKTIDVVVPTVAVNGITVSSDGGIATVAVGSNLQLVPVVTPPDADNRIVSWSSSDNTLATVDAGGKVTGKATGNVRITAAATDGSGITGYIDLTVTPVLVTDFTITPSIAVIPFNSSATLTAGSFLPTNAQDKTVTWELVSGPAGCRLDPLATTGTTCKIETGSTAGSVTVKATANDDNKKSKTYVIDVRAVLVNTITLAGATCVRNNDAITIIPTISPSNTQNKDVTWNVTGNAEISEQSGQWCKIIAKSPGGSVTVTATATDGSGKTAQFTTYSQYGPNEEGAPLVDGQWTYTTWQYPNGAGTWMTQGSKHGEHAFEAYGDPGVLGEGFWYTYAQTGQACPSGWSTPTETQATLLVNWYNSTCALKPAAEWIPLPGRGQYLSATGTNSGNAYRGYWGLSDGSNPSYWALLTVNNQGADMSIYKNMILKSSPVQVRCLQD